MTISLLAAYTLLHPYTVVNMFSGMHTFSKYVIVVKWSEAGESCIMSYIICTPHQIFIG